MSDRLSRLALVLALAAPLAIPAVARAEDAPPEAPKPAPDAPPEAPKPAPDKPKKPETNEASIFLDWKLVQNRGVAHARGRAEFWAGKNVAGKDLMWLGNMWDRGEDYAKAAAAFEGFLEYKPPADDQKAVSNNLTNRESARKKLISVYTKAKEFDKAVAAAEKFREEFAASPVIAESWDDQGRAMRLAGDDAKAVAAFTTSAEGKFVKGLMDLLDVHQANGDVEAAKADFDKLPKDDSTGFRDKFIQSLRTFVDSIGNPAPGLDKLTSVGRGEAPVLAGKPTLFYFWHMQMGLADKKLANMENIRRSLSDVANVVGIAKYNKYNPQTSKIEAEMTPEQEIDWYKKSIAEWGILLPCVVATDDVIEGLHLKYEGQFVIVDGEGKLRYMRINGELPYDRQTVEMALKKASEKK